MSVGTVRLSLITRVLTTPMFVAACSVLILPSAIQPLRALSSMAVAGRTPEQRLLGSAAQNTRPPAEASQFNFLIGQWDLTVKPKARTLGQRVHGVPTWKGTWKVWRALDGWGIEDELRVTDAAGNPRSLTHSVRVFSATSRTWTLSTLDVYRGVFGTATSSLRGQAMQTESQGTDENGKPYRQRVIVTVVSPTQLRVQHDRSSDGGRTWDERTLVMEATRTAAMAPR